MTRDWWEQELQDPELVAYFEALASEEIPEPDPARWARLRQEYRALVQALRPAPPWWVRWREWFALRPPALRWALAFVMLLGFLWGSGAAVVNAAQEALPGSWLYPVKQWHENWLLARARDPQQRARLHQAFAHRRVNEIKALLAQGREAELQGVLENLLAHVDALAGMVEQDSGVPPTLMAELVPLAALAAPTPYQQELVSLLNRIAQGERLVGVLEARQGDVWVVSGKPVRLAAETLIQGIPKPGDVLEIIGYPRNGEWEAQWIRVAARASDTQRSPRVFVTGRLERHGDVWTIQGQPFVPADPAQAAAWQPGQMVEAVLRWNPERGMWEAEFLQPEAAFRARERKVQGVLEAIEGQRVRIAGQWWVLADHAEIEGPLQPGVWVEAELWQNIEGEWLVVELEVEDEGPEDEEDERHEGATMPGANPSYEEHEDDDDHDDDEDDD